MSERPALTRRSLVQAAGAGIGATVTGMSITARAAVPDPDSALLDLIARHAAVVAERGAFQDHLEAAERQFKDAVPARPAMLNERFGDEFGVGRTVEVLPNGRRRGYFGDNQIAALRRLPPPTWRRWDSEPAPWDNEEITRFVDLPDPRRVARLAEILAAYDAWDADKQALADRIGLTAATAEDDRLYEIVWDLRDTIRDTTPATLAGLGAKARWAMGLDDAEEENEAIVRDLAAFGQVMT